MKMMTRIGLLAVACLILARPALSQRGRGGGGGGAEATEFQDFTDETSAVRKVQLGEAFIAAHKNSNFRPQIDGLLATEYTKAQNWAKVVEVAERLEKEVPGANARAKAGLLTSAMLAALRTNDMTKAMQFGDWLVMGDPTDVNPYQILSAAIPERLPQDAAARTAALDKALAYATKGIALQKPPRIPDADWNGAQTKLHAALAFIDLNMNKIPEAVSEYEIAIKGNPKDAVAQFRLGLAYYYQMQDAGPGFIAANKAVDDAVAAKADNAKVNDLVAKRQAAEKEILAKRDLSIDSLARAVAIGGAVAQPARQQLEPLFKNKNPEAPATDLDKFVATKKTELGL